MKKVSLIIVTILMTALGAAIAYLSIKEIQKSSKCEFNGQTYKVGAEIPGYKEDHVCQCQFGGNPKCEPITDRIEAKKNPNQTLPEDVFIRDNLAYSSKFLAFAISSEVSKAPLNTVFKDVTVLDSNKLKITLEQKQMCSEAKEPQTQIGFYFFENNRLVLYSVANNAEITYKTECNVENIYEISNLQIDASQNFTLQYQSEDNKITTAPICVYNKAIYNNGDIYRSSDGCNVCTCSNGVSQCSQEKNCQTDTTIKSVYLNQPNYQRYEYPESEGECNNDSQCFTGGCSNEVCSATNGINSTCEAITKINDAQCKCVSTKCIWTK